MQLPDLNLLIALDVLLEADSYPRITLSGDLGFQALQLSELDG